MLKRILILSLTIFLISCTYKDNFLIEVNHDPVNDLPFIGIGVEWDTYNYSVDPLDHDAFEKLEASIKQMKPSFVRVMVLSKWAYNEGYTFESKEMKELYRVLDFCQTQDIDVILTDWGVGSSQAERLWLKINGIEKCTDKLYGEVIANYMSYLIHNKGYDHIKYLIVSNEPNLEIGDFSEWQTCVLNVSQALKDKGLDPYVKLVGSGESNGYTWHQQTVTNLIDTFNLIDYHGYPDDQMVKSGDLYQRILRKNQLVWENDRKGILISEAGVSPMDVASASYGLQIVDYGIQALNAGVSGISAWSFDDNAYPEGFNTSMIELDTMKERDWFHAWSMLSKGFSKDAIILESTPVNDSVRYALAKLPGGYSMIIVNRSNQSIHINIDFRDNNRYDFSLTHYRVKEKKALISKDVKSIDLRLPYRIKLHANSIILMTTNQ